ncbi:MAG TPA: ChbG/HpnK family deacetylase [Gemmatimonadales bacterium]|nr:ChbG/HpnK family deacetylase [Gemmatimonadales bacterium]
MGDSLAAEGATPVLRRILVSADDFGLSPAVDRGILEASRRGVVHETAFMTGFPEAAEAVARLRAAPGLAVGIHLDLTAGRPLLPARTVPSLVDAAGRFHRLPTLLLRAAAGRVRPDEVRREWRAQLERGLGLGLSVASLSSHRHVHMLPGLFEVALSLAAEHGIPRVRRSRFAAGLRRLALSPFARRAAGMLRAAGLPEDGWLLDFGGANARDRLARLTRRLGRLPPGRYELVTHPGYLDATLAERDGYLAGRLSELEAMLDPRFRSLLGPATVPARPVGTAP